MMAQKLMLLEIESLYANISGMLVESATSGDNLQVRVYMCCKFYFKIEGLTPFWKGDQL
jgi:hypothetical protein